MSSNCHRLRKYERKKRKARDPQKFNRLARLYWRYHFKVHGPHACLWVIE
jgi:hypothetical protein